jgi:transcriptional regulator with XRE-family HTH domain
VDIIEANIADLTWASFIYPRGGKSEETVKAYVEAIRIGAKFPPIKIQRVFNYPGDNEKTEAFLILDGIHRWSAFKECGYKKIAAVEWKKGPIDYEKSRIPLLLESAKCNLTHGDRLNRLGWTQEQIAEVAGLSRNRISEIVGNTNFGEIDTLLSQGRDMAYIAGHYNMDLALAWALRLEGKTDQEKFNELGWGLRTWDQWNFTECDERFGDDWPGRIPAQLVAHTVFYFTNPGDLVLDPMAGGCVVSDVCLVFERRCQSFNLILSQDKI